MQIDAEPEPTVEKGFIAIAPEEVVRRRNNIMGLSAGGFFKNFVKGAAQQYNTNIAFEKTQEAEEERAKKKEKRQFGYDKKLKRDGIRS